MRVRGGTIGARFLLIAVLGALSSSRGSAAVQEQVAYLVRTGDYWQVWVMQPDGSKPRQVTRSTYEKSRISWFPDGKSLLLNGLDGRLYRVDVETGKEMPVEVPTKGMTDAVLSPDGRWIAFSFSPNRDDNDIWVVDIDGKGERRVAGMLWLQHDPQWSHDGKSIFFMSGEGGQSHDLWVVSLESGSSEQLTAGALYNFDVAIAGDATAAFSSNRSGNYEIWTHKPGEPDRQITNNLALDAGPAWAPDDSALLFHSTRSGALELWRAARDGGDPRQLTRHKAGARMPVWWRSREPAS